MLELIAEGQVFDMDPPRWMLRRDVAFTNLWRILRIQGYEVLMAPVDVTCIPARVFRSSVEDAIAKGALRPCSLVPA